MTTSSVVMWDGTKPIILLSPVVNSLKHKPPLPPHFITELTAPIVPQVNLSIGLLIVRQTTGVTILLDVPLVMALTVVPVIFALLSRLALCLMTTDIVPCVVGRPRPRSRLHIPTSLIPRYPAVRTRQATTALMV